MAYDQICRQDKVPDTALRRMNLMLLLSVHRGGRRQIQQVWQSDGLQPHRLAYEAGNGGLATGDLVAAPMLTAARQVVGKLLFSGRRTTEDEGGCGIQSLSCRW